MYNQLMKYLEKNENKLKELKMHRSRIKIIKNQTKHVHLCFDIKLLYFIEINEKKSICLVENEIDKFLKIVYENHDHFS